MQGGKMISIEEKARLEIWGKGVESERRDPKEYRKDCFGNNIRYSEYKQQTKHGWKDAMFWDNTPILEAKLKEVRLPVHYFHPISREDKKICEDPHQLIRNTFDELEVFPAATGWPNWYNTIHWNTLLFDFSSIESIKKYILGLNNFSIYNHHSIQQFTVNAFFIALYFKDKSIIHKIASLEEQPGVLAKSISEKILRKENIKKATSGSNIFTEKPEIEQRIKWIYASLLNTEGDLLDENIKALGITKEDVIKEKDWALGSHINLCGRAKYICLSLQEQYNGIES